MKWSNRCAVTQRTGKAANSRGCTSGTGRALAPSERPCLCHLTEPACLAVRGDHRVAPLKFDKRASLFNELELAQLEHR